MNIPITICITVIPPLPSPTYLPPHPFPSPLLFPSPPPSPTSLPPHPPSLPTLPLSPTLSLSPHPPSLPHVPSPPSLPTRPPSPPHPLSPILPSPPFPPSNKFIVLSSLSKALVCEDVGMYVHGTSNVELRNNVRLLLNVELRNYVISRQIVERRVTSECYLNIVVSLDC